MVLLTIRGDAVVVYFIPGVGQRKEEWFIRFLRQIKSPLSFLTGGSKVRFERLLIKT